MGGPVEVMVVGAGPTGLVAAIQLRRFGVEVEVVDRAAAPATTSRALGCHARTMEVLEDVGVVADVLQVARPLRGASYFRGDRQIARMLWEPPDAPFPYPYMIPQRELEEILRRRLRGLGVEVRWGCELTGAKEEDGGVTASTSEGSERRAGWLLGCDGAHSRVREIAGIRFSGEAYPEVYHLGDLQLDLRAGLDDSRAWVGGERPIMAMPLDGAGLWRVLADVTPAEGGRVPPPTEESFQRLLDERAFGRGAVKVLASRWLSTFRLQRRHAESYRAGRLFLAGDAAHVFAPFGGQGMNTGIQDAYALAWRLAAVVRGWGRPALLDTYHAERHAIGSQVIAHVERSRRVMTWRHPLAGPLRDAMLAVLMRSRGFRRRACLRGSELALSYRGLSWLSEQTGPCAGPQAGDRAPDGLMSGARLYTLRDGTRFLLLVFSGPGGPPRLEVDPRRVQVLAVGEAEDALRRRYGAGRGALVLVRPDGYIGFRGGLAEGAALRRYLDQALVAGG